MAVASRGRLRGVWFRIHQWSGVGLAALLIPLGLSGSYLVWREPIDRLTHPARFAVGAQPATLPPSAYLDAAQGAFGDNARVSSLRLPSHPGEPVTVTGQVRRAEHGAGQAPRDQPSRGRPRMLTAWIDPGAARVLEVANPRDGFSMWVHDLHGQFFVFGAGRQIVGWLGWAMTISCLSGLWLWWPRNGGLAKALRWRRGPGVLINLHYMVGFWIAAPLAVLSVTGALIAFPSFTRSVVGAAAPLSPPVAGRGGPPGAGMGAPMGHTALSPDEVAASVARAYPQARLVSLTLPSRGPAPPAWRVQVRPRGAQPLTLSIPDAPDSTPRALPTPLPTAGDQTIRLIRQIHEGDDLPALWRWIITLAGLAPALLGITGVVMWVRRSLRRSALRKAPEDEAPQTP